MLSKGSVSQWLDQLQAGDSAAAQNLWDRYFQRLAGLALKKFKDLPRRVVDEEDVALSVFDSFCRGAQKGQFPALFDRDNLWALLVVLTSRKVLNVRRDERRLKRGGGLVRGESALIGPRGGQEAEEGLNAVLAREPTPEFAAQMAEECRRLLNSLADVELRSIALWKMEGDTTEQIAAKLQRSPRTIERKLQLIRSRWENQTVP
ncbi:MAG TPA: ECF-type sigma factor [Gemmataceae bacterium]|nr:ECF-type sigma factor [Gemmataceae bacterium]